MIKQSEFVLFPHNYHFRDSFSITVLNFYGLIYFIVVFDNGILFVINKSKLLFITYIKKDYNYLLKCSSVHNNVNSCRHTVRVLQVKRSIHQFG